MKKLVLIALTVALTMVMAFSVSAGSKLKVSNIYSNTTKVKVKFPKKAKYKVVVKVKKPGTKKYKKLKTVKTKKVKSKVIKIKVQKKGSKVQFKATNLKTKKSYKKTLTVKGKTKEPNKYKYSNGKKEETTGTVTDNNLKTYTTLDTPEMQKKIAEDREWAIKNQQSIDIINNHKMYYSISKRGELCIHNDIKYSFEPISNGGMLDTSYEDFYETNKTLKNGQFIYNLSNNRFRINIPKGCKVYLNIKGWIDTMRYGQLSLEEQKEYFNKYDPAMFIYPTKDNYDLCLTSDDKYISDIGYYCEAREGCSIKDFNVYVMAQVICATVYDENNNLVAYDTYSY